MTQISLGDMAHSFALRRQSVALDREAQRLATEVTTGRAADTARALRGDLVPLSAIETSLTRLEGFRVAASEAALVAQGMQDVLTTLDNLAGDLSTGLLSASSAGQSGMLPAVTRDAAGRLHSAMAALNTRLGDRTLLAGVATDGPAVRAGATLIDELTAEIAGAATADDVAARVGDWFARPDGYAATVYAGSGALVAAPLSPDDSVQLDLTANDPVIRATLQGLALAALLDRGVLAGDDAARNRLARAAGEQLFSGQADRASLAGRLGTAESRIEAARQRNDSEASALQLARTALLATDGYEAATRLEAVQGQIEALYAVTARLSRLSLVDFL